jgi:hypothetical protein
MLTLISNCIPDVGTFGRILHEGHQICVTVEQPWNNNEPFKSCVPAGDYTLEQNDSPRYGAGRWYLVNPSLGVVAQGSGLRTHCLFHGANFPWELKGCVGPGTSFSPQNWGVVNSKVALELLEAVIESLPEKRMRIIRNEI